MLQEALTEPELFARVTARLMDEFADRDAVAAAVAAAQERYATVPVRLYLPVIVEREARAQLRASTVGAVPRPR